jgi:hypothetical protein
MKVVMISTHASERVSFARANKGLDHNITFVSAHLNAQTVELAKGFPAVSTLPSDTLDAAMLKIL